MKKDQPQITSQEIGTCAFCRAETSVIRQYLHAKNKPAVGDGFDFIRYCNECGLLEVIQDQPKCTCDINEATDDIGHFFNCPMGKIRWKERCPKCDNNHPVEIQCPIALGLESMFIGKPKPICEHKVEMVFSGASDIYPLPVCKKCGSIVLHGTITAKQPQEEKTEWYCGSCKETVVANGEHLCEEKTEEWKKRIRSILGNVYGLDELVKFTIELLQKEREKAQKEENEAWIRRERCSICGKQMKAKPLTDICDKCFEEA